MRKTQIGCIVFRKKGNTREFLLLRRISEKGGFWQPVSGGKEKQDKTLLDAAYRELKEEANIKQEDVLRVFEKVHHFKINRHYLTGEPIPEINEYVFGFEVKPDVNVSINVNIYPEHDKKKWVLFEEAIELLKWEHNKYAFKKLNNLLDKGDNCH